MKSAAFIIATKDRPQELRRLLKSIEQQSLLPGEIIIIDAGAFPDKNIANEFPDLSLRYLHSLPPSATRQRNEGLACVSPSMEYVGFIDDDAVFDSQAFSKMDSFWKRTHSSSAGASFNLMNHPPLQAGFLKTQFLTNKLGFYSSQRGIVLRNGFQTMIGTVKEDTRVSWLPSTAVLWRKSLIYMHRFDEWYTGYSYLEDLDFSYSLGKFHDLYVVAEAKYYHLPSKLGRTDEVEFGKREILHRLHFVGKNPELSFSKCYQTLALRIMMSFFLALKNGKSGYFKRVIGNLIGLVVSWRQFKNRPSKT